MRSSGVTFPELRLICYRTCNLEAWKKIPKYAFESPTATSKSLIKMVWVCSAISSLQFLIPESLLIYFTLAFLSGCTCTLTPVGQKDIKWKGGCATGKNESMNHTGENCFGSQPGLIGPFKLVACPTHLLNLLTHPGSIWNTTIIEVWEAHELIYF